MVCVKSDKLALDDFMIQGRTVKVNRSEGSFTICLQPEINRNVLFTEYSK